MLSVVTDKSKITVGASASIFGILGALAAFLIINWTALEKYGSIRSQLCCIIGFLLFFSLIFSLGPNTDVVGHLGGLTGGLLFSLAILPGLEEKNQYLTFFGAAGISIMNLTTFLVFFLTD